MHSKFLQKRLIPVHAVANCVGTSLITILRNRNTSLHALDIEIKKESTWDPPIRGGKSPCQYFGAAFERPGIARSLARNTWVRCWRAGRASSLATIQTTTKIQGRANILVGSALVPIQTHPYCSVMKDCLF